MMNLKDTGCRVMIMLAGGLNIVQAASPPSVNLSYRGHLVAEPCTVLPEDGSIAVEFGVVIDKYLYLNTRTRSKSFQLRLSDCDPSTGNTVKVTFSGTESTELPGLLAPDGSSEATGIAIGLETQEGQPLALNQQGVGREIIDGSNVIALQAYVRGEPGAITGRSISRGNFSGVATFNLEYE